MFPTMIPMNANSNPFHYKAANKKLKFNLFRGYF